MEDRYALFAEDIPTNSREQMIALSVIVFVKQ